ncbi:MAG TPA: ribosome-associated translation inhibitor RaiA [Pyrinomonadaceae bacterium]|jgi:ribosome hibernation promoting factor
MCSQSGKDYSIYLGEKGTAIMRFEYTGRHVEVSPAIREHVEDNFKKLDHIFNGKQPSVHVIITVEKNRHIGEVVVHWLDHTLTAKEVNLDMYLALTRAIEKVEKQALKLKKKIIDRKQGARRTAAVAPTPDGQLEASPRPPRIINARRYSIKPMTAEEAALQLSAEPDQFIVFRDADTKRIGVLYKRKDGNFGLIER